MTQRVLGIDAGAETIKIVELRRRQGRLVWHRRELLEHHKDPGAALGRALRDWDWDRVSAATASGRFSLRLTLPRVPGKQAQAAGFRFLFGDRPATLVSIGGRGFSVLELRAGGGEVFRENSRCSQGTGNFLRQLVERFGLTVQEAADHCRDVADPAPLSGRCPVILKTDMTHLANRGEDRTRILAGLIDAVCENVQVLVKPGVSPPAVILLGGVTRSERVRRNFARFLAERSMELIERSEDEALFLEALGCAVIASPQAASGVAPLERLIAPASEVRIEEIEALSGFRARVVRMPRQATGARDSEDRAQPPLTATAAPLG